MEIFQKFFLTKTKKEILERAAKEEMLIGVYRDVKDIVECPQLEARDYFVKIEHPEIGESITYPGAWAKTSEAQWRVGRRAPLIGEHNMEIYERELGFSKKRIISSTNEGVI